MTVAGGVRGLDNGGVVVQAVALTIAAMSAAVRALGRHTGRNGESNRNGAAGMSRGEPLPAVERALYVVATPIGNLRDITLRVLDVLRQVDVIAAEDTRVTAVLLAQHGIRARLLSVNAHNERRRADEIVALLESGSRVALVSDAGTPGVSDPGALLVRAVAAAGHAVVPVPGPSAAIAAISAAGLSAKHWLFYGFLPTTATARRTALDELARLPFALVFYEAPHRVREAVLAMADQLGDAREVVIARELTKRFETIHRTRLGETIAWIDADRDRERGEFVLVVEAPPSPDKPAVDDSHDATLALLMEELPLTRAVRLAAALTGAPRKRLYERALALKSKKDA